MSRHYSVVLVSLNTADYGVPQKRERVLIAGVRADSGSLPVFPRPTHTRERLVYEKWLTGEYWRRHGMSSPPASAIPQSERGLLAKLRRTGEVPAGRAWVTCRDAFAGLGEPVTNDASSAYALRPGARSYPGHTGSALDEPAKALRAGVHGVPGGENMLVLDDGSVRYLTVREAARLQGLPDDYRIEGCWSQCMRQLGNALPATFATVAGRWLQRALA